MHITVMTRSHTGNPSSVLVVKSSSVTQVDQVLFVTLTCSKRFQNEMKIVKYLNILDLLYFVIVMCCFGLISGAGRYKKGEIYIYTQYTPLEYWNGL